MTLPESFVSETQRVLGQERYELFLQALGEEPPVSIRLNTGKVPLQMPDGGQAVPWCPEGIYLSTRPAFTFDPLLHAGCYYVQEAASMFVTHILRQYVDHPVAMLDMCAAPGGKSTAAISVLPKGSTLVSNEPMKARAQVLLENMTKWGHEGCEVTSQYPKTFSKARQRFDVILCDVPCSGEGMFRKDPKSISEWSPQKVAQCQKLQREIVGEAWKCLNDGGLLIYSTCTLNTRENEENVQWIVSELGASLLPVPIEPAWGISGSMLESLSGPVYRFIPGLTRSEGLFIAAMRKGADSIIPIHPITPIHPIPPLTPSGLHMADLPYATAISYLRGEAIVLPPDTPRGQVVVTFRNHPLGLVKNIGNRANNLYPKEWRIKSTHIPKEYEAILRTT